MKTIVPPDQIAQIRQWWKEGKSRRWIAKKSGWCGTTVIKLTRDMRRPQPRIPIAEMLRLHAEGLSQEQIAQRLGYTQSGVCGALQRVKTETEVMREAA